VLHLRLADPLLAAYLPCGQAAAHIEGILSFRKSSFEDRWN